MIRTYFKNQPHQREDKLYKFAKDNDADYIDNEGAVWKMPKQYGTSLFAIQLSEDGMLSIGKINPDCDNFETMKTSLFPEEQKWLYTTLAKITKYKRR